MTIGQRRFGYDQLPNAPLIVDAAYEGGHFGDVRDDPISRLLGGGNQGGFRYLGSLRPFAVRQCVLYTDLSDPDWPDRLDVETGRFIYFGDNKTPGQGLHDTQRRGNLILREVFERTHTACERPCRRFSSSQEEKSAGTWSFVD
jgi:hypothetical protein